MNLEDLFAKRVESVTETILSGSELIEDVHRLVWQSECGSSSEHAVPGTLKDTLVTLEPMTVRTFIVKFA